MVYLLRCKCGKGFRLAVSLKRAFELLETNYYDIANLACDRFVDKYEFYREILKKYEGEL